MNSAFRPPLSLFAALALVHATGCSKNSEAPSQAAPQVNLAESDILQQPVAPAVELDPTSTVATVNGQAIQAGELERQLAMLVGSMRNRMPPEQLAQLGPRLREQALNSLVAKHLLTEAVAKEKITATPEEIAEAKAKIEAGLPPGMTLADVLKQRNISVEQFEEEFGAEFLINKLIEQKTADLAKVDESEAKIYYEKNSEQFAQPETVTARHILIGFEPGATDEVKAEKKAKAEKVREQLLAGGDFAELAAKESEDPGSKDNGGVYTFPRGQMVPQFEAAAFSQTIGEVGPLVETQFGYHIIKVDERNEARSVPFTEVQSNLVQYLTMRKTQQVAQNYVEGLRSNAQVQVLLNQP